MTYYPKSHIKSGLYTRGKEWMLRDGTEYKGSYHKTFDGKVQTESLPSTNSVTLIPYSETAQTFPQIIDYDLLPKDTNVRGLQFPKPSFPNLDDSDYQAGFIIRYFTQKNNDINDPIRELNKKEYDRVNNDLSAYFYTISLKWKITGPKYDTVQDGNNIPGIADTNKRTLFRKRANMPGIIQRLPNLLQFSEYTESVGVNDL